MSCSLAVAGEIEYIRFYSEQLGVEKDAVVWLPDGYDTELDNRYPVIYQLHGWGVTERSWTGPSLKIQESAQSIDLQAIIVMPDGDRSIYANAVGAPDYDGCITEKSPKRNSSEPRSSFCVRQANYENYIIDDLIPYIDGKFRTIPDRTARAVSGESAGGNGAMSLALRNQEKFSSVVSHSGALSLLYSGPEEYSEEMSGVFAELPSEMGAGEVFEILGPEIANWRGHDPYHLAATLESSLGIYFDCGAEDEFGFQNTALQFRDKLTALGIPHEFHLEPGGHSDEFWRTRASHGLNFHKRHFIAAGHYAR